CGTANQGSGCWAARWRLRAPLVWQTREGPIPIRWMGEVLPGELGRGGGAERTDDAGYEQRGAAISAVINPDPDCLRHIDQEYCGDHSRPRRAPPECDCPRKEQALDQNFASEQKPRIHIQDNI